MSTDAWIRLPIGLTRFDDDSYLMRRRDHRADWILNCGRQPRASDVKCHRADCTYLRPRPGWTNLTTAFAKERGTLAVPCDEWLAAAFDTPPDRCPACQS